MSKSPKAREKVPLVRIQRNSVTGEKHGGWVHLEMGKGEESRTRAS